MLDEDEDRPIQSRIERSRESSHENIFGYFSSGAKGSGTKVVAEMEPPYVPPPPYVPKPPYLPRKRGKMREKMSKDPTVYGHAFWIGTMDKVSGISS